MKISSSRGLASGRAFKNIAFTLIELLVVISIIAILAAMTVEGGRTVQISVRKASAKNDLSQMSAAVRAYYNDYGQYPIPNGTPTGDMFYGPTAGYGQAVSNDQLFNVLRFPPGFKDPNNQNPRQIKYLEVAYVRNNSAPVSGIVQNSSGSLAAGSWVDPWGAPYIVFIDGDYDSCVTVSNVFTSGVGVSGTVPISAGAASVGLYAIQPGSKAGPHQFSKNWDLLSWQ